MVSRWIRTWYGALLRPFLFFLAQFGITANHLTVASLFVVMIAGILFALGKTAWGAGILLLGGFLDGIDGALAQITSVKSPLGGFLDSICDHCGDFAVYLGLLLRSLQSTNVVQIILIFIALFASVFGSHVRSHGGMVGIDTKTVGVFTRAERILVLVMCILANQLTIGLWVLAILNSLSALERVVYTLRIARQSESILQSQEI